MRETTRINPNHELHKLHEWGKSLTFHVYHQAVKNTKISKRIRNKKDDENT